MKHWLTTLTLSIVLLLSMSGTQVFAQHAVKGKVTDKATGESIPGATILVQGTTNGTLSDLDGVFTIEMDSSQLLEISFVGFQTEVVKYASSLNVALTSATESLDEVMVIGYGTVQKKDATGSVTSLGEGDFNQAPAITAENLLQGRTTGVTISPNNGGAPGGGASIKIRGTGSLSLTTEPLIIVDDVPLAFGNIGGSRNILESINPNDIESMTVLKDASATAIYGSRASNGVIIITTKEGKANQPLKVVVDSKVMVSTPRDMVDVMSAAQFTDFVNEYGSDSSKSLLGTSNTDWQDQIYRTAITSDNNVSVTGSVKGVPVRASLGYIAQDGILETDEMNRFTSALNVSPSLLDNHLKVELNGKYTYVANDFADRGAIGAAAAFDPTQSVYREDGRYTNWYNEDIRNINTTANPMMLLKAQEDMATVNRFIGNAKFDYKFHFLPDLKATLNVGYDRAWATTEKYKLADWEYTQVGQLTDDSRTEATNYNKLLDLYLTYNKEVGNHRVNATGGYAYQSFYSESQTVSSSTFEDETKNVNNILIPSINEDVLISFFARGNYSFKDKYLFTATVRADASSKLNPDDRWGVFPSASFAWRLSEEGFLDNAANLSNLKLRMGYGQMGNVGNLGNYQYLTRYTSSA
ncbi:MAG: SusC/RagA family TonB-linked outer membrane protein, partial [Mangrovibacterium sp.]